MAVKAGSGLCGDSNPYAVPAADAKAANNDPAWMAAQDAERRRQMSLGGKPALGNVPGSLPDAPSPLDPSAPQKTLPAIAPQNPYNNTSRVQTTNPQGNAAGQSAAAGGLAKMFSGGGF